MGSVDLLNVLNSLAEVGDAANRLDGENSEQALNQLIAGVGRVLEGAEASLYGLPEQGKAPDLLAGPGLEPECEPVGRYPLVVAGRSLGELAVHYPEGFSPITEAVLRNFANQAATILSHASSLGEVRRDLERREEDLDHLRRSGLLISSRLGLGDTLEAILEMALEVTGARYGIFRLLNREGQLVTRAVAGEGMESPLVEALAPEPDSVTGWVAHHRQSVCISDLRERPWSELYYPLDEELEMRSEVAVPLVDGAGRLEGVLNLESPQAGAFSQQDRLLLEGLASQAIVAIGQARLVGLLQRVSSRLLTLPCSEVLQGLAERAGTLANVEAGIWLVEQGDLVLAAGHDLSLEEQTFRVPLGSSEEPVGWFGAKCEGAWEAKVVSSLAHYATLALDYEGRQKDLVVAREQRAVAESFAAVGDLSANLMHRLNNKVGIIPVRVDGIRDRCQKSLAQDPYLQKNLNAIETSAREAMKVVADNFSLLAPSQGGGQSLAAVLERALEEVALSEGVQVSSEGLLELPTVIAEEHALRLVFANLLENAAKAMQGEGRILVRGLASPGWVEVEVSDTGPGIPQSDRKKIFEPRFSEGRSRGKLGFGLWWVRTLMARLGGTVEVDQAAPKGALFRLRFPLGGSQA